MRRPRRERSKSPPRLKASLNSHTHSPTLTHVFSSSSANSTALRLNVNAEEDITDEIDQVTGITLDYDALVQGISASLQTLIIASFRAPATRFILGLLRRLNPTTSLLRAHLFCRRHPSLLAMLAILNVNMGALDLSHAFSEENSLVEAYNAHGLLQQMSAVFDSMPVSYTHLTLPTIYSV